MRGSIWQIVALGTGIAMVPAVLGVNASGDTAQAIEGLLAALMPVLGVSFAVVVLAVVIVFAFGSDGF